MVKRFVLESAKSGPRSSRISNNLTTSVGISTSIILSFPNKPWTRNILLSRSRERWYTFIILCTLVLMFGLWWTLQCVRTYTSYTDVHVTGNNEFQAHGYIGHTSANTFSTCHLFILPWTIFFNNIYWFSSTLCITCLCAYPPYSMGVRKWWQRHLPSLKISGRTTYHIDFLLYSHYRLLLLFSTHANLSFAVLTTENSWKSITSSYNIVPHI